MADGLTTMFGKAYDTVGSADKNLILQTRGDLKVKWGGKYIDLIKNGKINVDVDLIKKVDSKDSIFKDGIYLLEEGEKQEVWLYIGGTLINLLGEVGTTYVSFIDKLIVTPDLKTMALTNAGFYYNTLTEALEALLTKGIVYILEENKLYYVSESGLTQYKEEFVIPDPFLIGKVTIEGSSARISGGTVLNLALGNANYISLLDEKVNIEKELLVNSDIVSHDYVQGMSGFAIYYNGDTSQTCAEFDNVKIRGILDYSNVINVTYKQLKQLRDLGKLIAGKKYRITDFRNEWEMLEYYYKRDNGVAFTNSWPIILTADTNKTFRTLGYFCDREDWVIEYDMDFYYYSHSQTNKEGNQEDIYTMGRITKLTDGFGNSANYDFKHRLFKHTSSSDDPNQWFYTYTILNGLYNKSLYDNAIDPDSYLNTHYYADASESGLITNNILYARRSSHEDGVNGSGNSCLKLVVYDEYIIFPDCSTIYPYGNQILDSSGKFIITGEFYNNIFEGLYTELDTEFTLDYHDNTFKKVKNCVLNAPMQFNIFDRNLIDVAFRCDSMSNNHITGIIYTNGNRESYPIEATHFNNNVINNINMSAITCYGCDIINNNIHNINGCTITNSTLTDITMKNISGDSSLYSNNPTDEIENVPGGNTPGGNTPDTPVNPGGGDTPVNPSGNTNIITSEPSATSVDSKMHGVHTNANPLENTAGTDVLLGYIDSGIDSSYGTPTVYGVYVCETGSMLSNVSVVPSSTTGRSYDIIGTVTANSVTSLKKVHVWIQFADVSQMGYVNVYQSAGSGNQGGETPSGDADVDEYLNTFKASSLSSTSLSNEEYSLLSTAMDKLDSFESGIMSDSMFVDDVLTLPSGNSSDTRDARRGWFMALLLTALHPMTGSTTVNNAILTDGMSNWGISQSTNTNTYSVSSYEAIYKGLLQGSIAFSWLFSDSSFVSSFKPFASYSYRGSDGDLGAGSTSGYYHAPKGQYFFPYPPTNDINASSGLMKRDEDAFKLGLDLRDTSRGTSALSDILYSLSYYLGILSTATGKSNNSGTPYTFLHDTQWNGNRTVNLIKNASGFWRSRPAWENNDTSVDSDTYDLNFGEASGKTGSKSESTSYPSGHTGYLWNTAYCYAAVGGLSSSAVVNLFKRAYQYSESRVVVGAHWLMCVEMGRIAAACSFATLCGNTKFIEELLAALS